MGTTESVAAQLMLRVASGNSAAFDQIYDDYAPMVLLRLRRRCRDSDVAAEVLQQLRRARRGRRLDLDYRF